MTPAQTQQANQETDAEFWAKTGYKPGQKLSASDPADAKMIPVWNAIHARVLDAFAKYGAVLPVALVDKETDARFWANTGYKPGLPLDPTSSLDATFVPVWNTIHDQVAKEVASGNARWTYNTPAVADAIARGQAASREAAAQIAAANAAKAAGDHATAGQHLANAHQQIGAAQVATAQAATAMPPPPAEIHPHTQAAGKAAHEVLSFSMDAGGHGVLTGVTGGSAPAPIAPEDQVAIVQGAIAPTRTAPAASLVDGGPDGSGVMPGGKGKNALVIAGLCVALAGGVAIANMTQKRIVVRRTRVR